MSQLDFPFYIIKNNIQSFTLLDFWPHVFCSYYYECTPSGPEVRFCPNPQFWNHDKKECDEQENVPECQDGTRFVINLNT